MKYRVEAWAPEYGTPSAGDLVESEVIPELGVEVSTSDWQPLLPDVGPADTVTFVDGVRRVDANLWIDQEGGAPALGLCAAFAAGAVRCSGDTARVVGAEVARGLFTAAVGAEDVETRHGTYRVLPTTGASPEELWLGIQARMGELEGRIAFSFANPEELLVVDGPLSHHRHVPEAVGYIKTQHRHYLPESLRWILPALPVGRRTPLFLLTGGSSKWSWYLRLAGSSVAGVGVVRCEIAADEGVAEAARLADRVTATLQRFASEEHKDPRAPQNLYPIGGLERELRHRLGDPQLMLRALRVASA